MSRHVQLPAPGRGAYDRSLSRIDRDKQHRERLFLAAAAVCGLGAPTVARIVEHAGVGRSTFYEFFDSPEHLLEQLEQRVQRAVQASVDIALAEAHTPLERVRAITRRFVAYLEAHRIEATFALAHRIGSPTLSAAAVPLHGALERVAEAARSHAVAWFRATDAATLLGATAAVEALARQHLTAAPLREPAKTMSDLVIKLLR